MLGDRTHGVTAAAKFPNLVGGLCRLLAAKPAMLFTSTTSVVVESLLLGGPGPNVASADADGGQIIVVVADNDGLVGWYGRNTSPVPADRGRLHARARVAATGVRVDANSILACTEP